jgi:hypothetical protein
LAEAMTSCAYCHAPNGDLFTPNGDSICQTCDMGFKSRMVQARANAQLASDPTLALTFASPKTLFRAGAGMIAGAIALGCLEVFVIGRVHIWLIGFLLVAGMSALYRSQT